MLEHHTSRLRIKAADADGRIEGLASVFDVVDSFHEVIDRGAFTQSLQDHAAEGTMPKLLWQHRSDMPIGSWTEMSENTDGLLSVGQINLATQGGREAHSLLKQGALDGLSIGFVARKMIVSEDPAEPTHITEVDLWEASIVTFPANPDARITDVKALGAIANLREAEDYLREAGLSRRQSHDFVGRLNRLIREREAPDPSTTELARLNEKIVQVAAQLRRK